MIGSLARKRTNLVAVAALLALVAALFVGLQSASAAPTLKVTSDSDGTVKAGTDVVITYQETSNQTSTDTVTFTAPKGGDVFFGTGDRIVSNAYGSDSSSVTATLKTTGAADGTYTITAQHGSNPALTVDVTISDNIGEEVGSAALSLAYRDSNRFFALSTTAGTTQDEDSVLAGNNIGLVLSVKNSLGKDANDGNPGGEANVKAGVSSINVVAPGGKVARSTIGGDPDTATGGPGVNIADTSSTDVAKASHHFNVTRAGAGTLEVWAIVVGTDGSTATTEKITLKFTGAPETISLGAVSGSLGDKDGGDNAVGVTFDVTAMDKSGNASAFTAYTDITATVKSAPTGGDKADLTIKAAENDGRTLGTTTTAATAGGVPAGAIRVKVEVTSAAAAPKPGDWTIEVKLGTKDTKTATVTVVGAPDSIEVSADMTEVGFGDVVTLTATVKDKNGNLVANTTGDDDGVSFTWAESGLKAQSLDNAAGGPSSGNRDITKGQATAKFVVVGRTGDALVIASSSGKKGTLSLSATATDQPEPTAVADAVTLETVGDEHSAGSVTVIATVTDEMDAPMPDGTVVTFYSSGDAKLFGPDAVRSSSGTATASYNATDDFTVLAVSGTVRGSLDVAVTSSAEAKAVTAAAEAAEAAADAAEAAADAAEAAAAAETAAAAQSAADDAAAASNSAKSASEDAAEAADDASGAAAGAAADAADSADAAAASADDAADSAAAAAKSAQDLADDEEQQAQQDEQDEQDRQDAIDNAIATETARVAGTSGFQTWLSEHGTTASALFTEASANGATAIHLWNGTSWVRYSVVDGQAVPGSTDFDIEYGNVLFISN